MSAEVAASLPIAIRPLADSDHSLVLSSWLRNNEPDPRIERPVYFKRHEALIKRWLLVHAGMFRTLADSDDPDHVYGWICGDPARGILHFVFVKPAFRRMGFARRLVDALFSASAPDFHSHTSKKLPWLKLNSHFDPYSFGGTP